MDGMGVPQPRATVNDSPEGLEILVPAPRPWVAVAVLTVWLAGWAAGETFAVRGILAAAPLAARLALALWLVFWTLGGAAALWSWAGWWRDASGSGSSPTRSSSGARCSGSGPPAATRWTGSRT